MKEKIHFYHMNDWHSHLDNWPKMERYFNYQKEQHIEDDEAVFLFDIGDACDRQHPLIEATDGHAMISLLNQIGIDAATIGNNEGIGNPHGVLEHLYDEAEFPVVLGNIIDTDSQQAPKFAQSYTRLQTEKGTRLIIFGMTAPFDVSYKAVNWEPLDPVVEIKKTLNQIKQNEEYDVLLFLSHLGLPSDRHLAKRFPEINIIFGSHTHHVLPEGEMVGNTLLTGGGKHGQFMGHVTVDLMINDQTGEVEQFDTNPELIAAERMGSYPQDDEQVQEWLNKGNMLLRQQIYGELTSYLAHNEYHYNDLQHFSLKAISYVTQADISILNSGLFLTDLKEGAISRYELHQSIPHPMRLMEINVSGKQVKAILAEMKELQASLVDRPIIGMGFRGNVFGTLATQPPGLLDDSSAIIEDKVYRLISVDHLIYLPFFTQLKKSQYHLWGAPFLREVIGDYINQLSL